jgi:sugar O-acyltransferase (sialic acid O-acetyltransferase NeuD family)
MKDLVIIGAGGFGRTVYWQCDADYGNHREWTIKGFLDDRPNILDGFGVPKPVLGSPFTYQAQPNEIWLCALGEPQMRRKYAAPILKQGVEFINLRTEVAYPESAKLGQGIIFERKVQVGSDTRIGDFVTILSMSVIGHDVTIGDYVQIASFTFIGARAKIGNDVQIHPHACILPGVTVGDRAVIGAGSVVVKNVPADTTVFGNPAKVVYSR